MPEASAAPDHAKYNQLNNNKGNKGDAECDPKRRHDRCVRALVCPIFKNTKSYNPIPWRTFQVGVEKKAVRSCGVEDPTGRPQSPCYPQEASPQTRRCSIRRGKVVADWPVSPESPTPSTRTRTLRHELRHDDSGLHPKCLTTVRTTEEFGVGGSAFLGVTPPHDQRRLYPMWRATRRSQVEQDGKQSSNRRSFTDAAGQGHRTRYLRDLPIQPTIDHPGQYQHAVRREPQDEPPRRPGHQA